MRRYKQLKRKPIKRSVLKRGLSKVRKPLKKTPLRKKGKSERSKLIDELDHAMSLIILKRDNRTCVICGSTYKPTNGHVLSKRHLILRWDVTNCFCQCWKCNSKHTYDTYPYYNWYMKTFGKEAFDDLYKRWCEESHFKIHDLKDLLVTLQSDL